MKNRIVFSLCVVCMICSLILPGFAASAKDYTDVDESAWYKDGVSYVIEEGFMTGTDKNVFSPNTSVTRAQAAQTLYAVSGRPEVGTRIFTDTAKESWYTKAVSYGAQEGFIGGYPEGDFRPNREVSREELVTMLYAFCGCYGKTMAISQASPVDSKSLTQVSYYARNAMAWAISNGIITGTDKGLEPRAAVTRAQIALIIRQYLTKLPDEKKNRGDDHFPVLTLETKSGKAAVYGAGSMTVNQGGTVMTSQASLASPTSKTVLNGGRIPAGKENVPLSWKNTPDKVTVRVWKITDAGNETAEPESERTLKNPYTITMEKNKIYEVIATWNQDDFEERGFYGEGYYRFVTA